MAQRFTIKNGIFNHQISIRAHREKKSSIERQYVGGTGLVHELYILIWTYFESTGVPLENEMMNNAFYFCKFHHSDYPIYHFVPFFGIWMIKFWMQMIEFAKLQCIMYYFILQRYTARNFWNFNINFFIKYKN